MRTTLGQLRELIRERYTLERKSDEIWHVTPGFTNLAFTDLAGMTLRRASVAPFRKKLRNSERSVTSPFLIRKRFDKNVVIDGFAPAGVRPIDVVRVIKSEQPLTVGDITLIPEPGLAEEMVQTAVFNTNIPQDIVYITSMDSTSQLAAMFGEALAAKSGAEFVDTAFIRQNARLEFPEDMVFTNKGAIEKSFERAKKKGDGKFQAKHFPKKFQHFIDYDIDIGDKLLDIMTDPQHEGVIKILLVDDVISTGNTLRSVVNELSNGPFEVVGIVTMFKTQET